MLWVSVSGGGTLYACDSGEVLRTVDISTRTVRTVATPQSLKGVSILCGSPPEPPAFAPMRIARCLREEPDTKTSRNVFYIVGGQTLHAHKRTANRKAGGHGHGHGHGVVRNLVVVPPRRDEFNSRF